jgi:hypothetical protein
MPPAAAPTTPRKARWPLSYRFCSGCTSALVVIIGARVNSEFEHQTARDSTTGRAQPLGSRDAEMADTVAPQPN